MLPLIIICCCGFIGIVVLVVIYFVMNMNKKETKTTETKKTTIENDVTNTTNTNTTINNTVKPKTHDLVEGNYTIRSKTGCPDSEMCNTSLSLDINNEIYKSTLVSNDQIVSNDSIVSNDQIIWNIRPIPDKPNVYTVHNTSGCPDNLMCNKGLTCGNYVKPPSIFGTDLSSMLGLDIPDVNFGIVDPNKSATHLKFIIVPNTQNQFTIELESNVSSACKANNRLSANKTDNRVDVTFDKDSENVWEVVKVDYST